MNNERTNIEQLISSSERMARNWWENLHFLDSLRMVNLTMH